MIRKSGVWTAFQAQRRALENIGVEVVTDPARKDYDILHLHAYGPWSFYYLKRAKRAGKMVVVHAHSIGSYDLKSGFIMTDQIAPFYERYLHHYYRGADSIFTPSARAKEILLEKGLAKPIEVVHNCIDSEKYSFSAEKRQSKRKDLNTLYHHLIGERHPAQGGSRLHRGRPHASSVRFRVVWTALEVPGVPSAGRSEDQNKTSKPAAARLRP
jgi:glycosyltransferase involved in cell wall biosynthesis